MGKIVDFDPRKRPRWKTGRNAGDLRTPYASKWPAKRGQRLSPWLVLAPLAAVVLGGAYGWATVPPHDTINASFSLCGVTAHITCVVDGDTFWLDGVKYRISDIDTPEVSEPKCQEERALGETAKYRLLSLLNEGPFGLQSGFRDKDRYGRKLRAVYRNGRSLGDVLVDEGLARSWTGGRLPWCG